MSGLTSNVTRSTEDAGVGVAVAADEIVECVDATPHEKLFLVEDGLRQGEIDGGSRRRCWSCNSGAHDVRMDG